MTSIVEKLKYQTHWTIKKYQTDAQFARDLPYEVAEIDGNILLQEGIQELLNLGLGLGTPTAYNNANARIGVGDSAVAEAATQTALQAATNFLYKGMETGFPTRVNQTATFRAVFIGTEANFGWNEFSVDNGVTPTKNLNRKVSAQGTKVSGQTWTVDVQITLS